LNGLSVGLHAIKQQLECRGHFVFVFAPSETVTTDSIPIPSVTFFPSEPPQKIPLPTNHLREAMRNAQLDIIHVHGGGAFSLLGLVAARLLKIPLIFGYHTDLEAYAPFYVPYGHSKLVRGLASTWARTMTAMAHATVVPSQKTKEILEGYGAAGRIEVIPMPVDPCFFDSMPRGSFRAQLDIPDGAVVLLSVSRLSGEKNLRFMLRATQPVLQTSPSTRLVIVGDGPERKSLVRLAHELGVADQVHFTGFLDRSSVRQVFTDSDAFLFTSRTETQGLAVAEAVASGLPVVAIQDRTLDGLVTSGHNGIISSESSSQFTNSVRLIVEDKALRIRLSIGSKVERSMLKSSGSTDRLSHLYSDSIKTYGL
jgi:glycosyltransferase involved in cell wall biosynthesis